MRETKIILLPQYILFPQERYFVPTTLLSCSLNILLLIPELLKTVLPIKNNINIGTDV